jgi:hypothetical protein
MTAGESKAIISFAAMEILEVHTLCDRAHVPTEINGELLSVSQRVNILERCYVGLVKHFGVKTSTHPLH